MSATSGACLSHNIPLWLPFPTAGAQDLPFTVFRSPLTPKILSKINSKQDGFLKEKYKQQIKLSRRAGSRM